MSHAQILRSIWDDPDFRRLSRTAQALYLHLLSFKKINLVGVLPLTPRAWAQCCEKTTVDEIEADMAELVEANFLVIDEDTEEVLCRTLVKHDPPRGAKTIAAVWRQYRTVDSPDLRAVIHSMMPPEAMAHSESGPEPTKDLQDAPFQVADRDTGMGPGCARAVHQPPATNHQPPATVHHEIVVDDQTEPAPIPKDDVKARRSSIIRAEAEARTDQQESVVSRGPYIAKVIREVSRDFGPSIEQALTKHPDAPDWAIADRVFREDFSVNLSDWDEKQAAGVEIDDWEAA